MTDATLLARRAPFVGFFYDFAEHLANLPALEREVFVFVLGDVFARNGSVEPVLNFGKFAVGVG